MNNFPSQLLDITFSSLCSHSFPFPFSFFFWLRRKSEKKDLFKLFMTDKLKNLWSKIKRWWRRRRYKKMRYIEKLYNKFFIRMFPLLSKQAKPSQAASAAAHKLHRVCLFKSPSLKSLVEEKCLCFESVQ